MRQQRNRGRRIPRVRDVPVWPAGSSFQHRSDRLHDNRCRSGRSLMKHALIAAAGLIAMVAAPTPVAAQTYPNKPVRMVIACPAGGSIDTLGRILTQKLSAE